MKLKARCSFYRNDIGTPCEIDVRHHGSRSLVKVKTRLVQAGDVIDVDAETAGRMLRLRMADEAGE